MSEALSTVGTNKSAPFDSRFPNQNQTKWVTTDFNILCQITWRLNSEKFFSSYFQCHPLETINFNPFSGTAGKIMSITTVAPPSRAKTTNHVNFSRRITTQSVLWVGLRSGTINEKKEPSQRILKNKPLILIKTYIV